MTPDDDIAYTVFRFVCGSCGANNEYLHEHRAAASPYLIMTSCTNCGDTNNLGGIRGVRVPRRESEC